MAGESEGDIERILQREAVAKLKEKEKEALRQRLLWVALTPEARMRLANVKIVKPEVVKMIEDHIIQLASSGKIQRPMTDDELKQILITIQRPKKEFKIRWV